MQNEGAVAPPELRGIWGSNRARKLSGARGQRRAPGACQQGNSDTYWPLSTTLGSSGRPRHGEPEFFWTLWGFKRFVFKLLWTSLAITVTRKTNISFQRALGGCRRGLITQAAHTPSLVDGPFFGNPKDLQMQLTTALRFYETQTNVKIRIYSGE